MCKMGCRYEHKGRWHWNGNGILFFHYRMLSQQLKDG